MSEGKLQEVSVDTDLDNNTEINDGNPVINIGLQDEEHIGDIVRKSISLSHTGPLPHPDILRGYEETLPGAAERVLEMAEKEQNHRIDMENKLQEADSRDSLLGIKFAYRISMTVTIVGAIIVIVSLFMRQNIAGIIFGGAMSLSGMSGVVAAFVKKHKTIT